MGGGTNPPICKWPRENPAGSCQCSVDPVLSSHDEPYFETYLSSQAFFTFVTTSASMKACFTLFLYPFPSTVQNYIQLSLCTNPWYNLFREKFKFRGFMKAFKNFAKYIIAFIVAKFKYFAKQIIYLESQDHPL